MKFLKKQQWTITNYGALIYGAIFGIKHLSTEKLTSGQVGLLKWFAFAAFVVGLIHLGVVERNMLRTRKQTNRAIKWIFGDYGGEEDGTERAQIIGPDDSSSFCRDLPFLLAFVLVVFGGLCVGG